MILIFTLSMTLTFTPFNQNQILWRGAKYWHVISWCVQRKNHGQCSGNGDFFSWSFLSLFSLIISFLLLYHFSCAAAFVVTRPLGLEQIRRTKTVVVDGLFWVCGSTFYWNQSWTQPSIKGCLASSSSQNLWYEIQYYY